MYSIFVTYEYFKNLECLQKSDLLCSLSVKIKSVVLKFSNEDIQNVTEI